MKKLLFFLFTILLFINLAAQEDHSDNIDGPFDTPQEVTEACLDCHEDVDKDIMKSRHWNWLGDEFTDVHGEKVRMGKQDIINNFCIAVSSNWPRCTSCHIGYGYKDASFDFSKSENIDCLVCHDQTGTYKKTPTGAGMPDKSVDLVKVAQSVGPTSRKTCGSCHFEGGGGAGVKHGDLDESLFNPSPELDVHMGGADFQCADCHAGENHQILGAGQASIMAGKNHFGCIGCHEEKPHTKRVLNKHSKSVACETCHIPTFARVTPTKTWWDWSKAGEDRKVEKDENGMPTYHKKKGEFIWSKNVVPEYTWYNGKADFYKVGDKIDPNNIVHLNSPLGDMEDPDAKITPFKVMRGKQIYDAGNNYLVVPKLFGKGGYWKTFDWNAAAELGMKSVNLPYSGKFGFIETEMYWPINHMVVSGDQALHCTSCHGKKGKKRLDWKKLGYKGDPLKTGSRFE